MHGRRLDPSICTHPSRARHQDMAPIVLSRTVDAPLRAVFAPRRQLAHVGKNRGEMSHVENLRPNTQTKREKHRQYEVICRATGTGTGTDTACVESRGSRLVAEVKHAIQAAGGSIKNNELAAMPQFKGRFEPSVNKWLEATSSVFRVQLVNQSGLKVVTLTEAASR